MSDANSDQAAYWNGRAGENWVAFQDVLDTILASVGARLFEHAAPAAGGRVLDLGCGTGATTLELARRVAPGGEVTGLDISQPMVEHAKARIAGDGADNARFVVADAQTHAFGGDGFDLLVSRLGAMFFADPVAAYANLGTALRPGGRVALVAWAEIERNPFFNIPMTTIFERVGTPAPTPPRAPGPMAFAEIDYVEDILRRAGFAEIEGAEEEVSLYHPGGAAALAEFCRVGGPGSRALRELDAGPAAVDDVVRTVEARFKPFDTPDGIRVPAKMNYFRAIRP